MSAVFNCIGRVYSEYVKYSDAKRYELEVTPQVFSLEKMLNDNLCDGQREITITAAKKKPILYLFRATNNKDVYLDSESFIFRIDTNGFCETFVVNVPQRYKSKIDIIKALLDKYKLVSRNYLVNFLYSKGNGLRIRQSEI
jgi:hypothetical protein